MKLNWGVLGAAKIAVEKVIPAMANHDDFQVYGIASRDLNKAQATASRLNIPKAYGSYEELIADPDIHVVYNPLPNHLHVEYTLKCIEAGKHVLCEKPIALSSSDVMKLILARDKQRVKVGEAFMIRTHPQWTKTKSIIKNGELGRLKLINGFFSYFNDKPDNIRNKESFGGGALWDIGCYPVNATRFISGEEPERVCSMITYDKNFGTDILSSVLMKFPSFQGMFSVSTQLVPYQTMQFFGDKKVLNIKIPFNAPKDITCEIFINEGDLFHENFETQVMDLCNQYTLQAEEFTKAVITNTEVPVPLEDSLKNTRALEAIFKSAKENRWVELKELE